MQSSAQRIGFLCLALQTVASNASSAGGLRHAKAAQDAESARRLAYPSVGELLTTSSSISELDVMVRKILHNQCVDIFMRGQPKETVLARTLTLNLTQYSLQSANTNVDQSGNKISTVVINTNGTQTVYTEQYTSRSFGCTMSIPKYAGLMTDAQSKIDGLSYEPDFILGSPERDAASFKEYSDQMCDSQYNMTRSILMYQKGKLVWEKYCTLGADKSSMETLENGAYPFTNMLAYIRQAEGKFNLDKLAFAPELTVLEKRARNMTGKNLAALRIGRPLQETPIGAKNPLQYDVPKMLYAVPDKANYAAVVPSSYDSSTANVEWSRQHYSSAGTTVLLSRELRFTFPDTSEGFAEYAAYPWSHLFSQIGARSVTMEADASGTVVGHTGLYATSRDLLKLAVLFQESGKWKGKQIVPEEYIQRNHNNPYGADQWLAEGWMRYKHPDMPALYFVQCTNGAIWSYPEMDLTVVAITNANNPKRWEDTFYGHFFPFIAKQMAAWATTTSTTTTTTIVTTTTTTVPTTTVTATSTTTVTSTTTTGTSTQASSHGNKHAGLGDSDNRSPDYIEETPVPSTATRKGSTLLIAAALTFILRLSC